MGPDMIADGVESAEQEAYLAERGCMASQGYLFGRPVMADDFEQQVLVWD